MPMRSVREALSSSGRSPKRRRIQIAACPICRTRMSVIILNTHIDRCRPPVAPSTPPSPTQPVSSQPASTQTAQPTQPSSIQSQLAPLPSSTSPPLYLTLTPETLHTNSCTCTSRPFTAAIPLRTSYSLHIHICHVKPFHIPPLPPGSPGLRLSPSILKSALQKAVRRRHVHPALRIAVVLLRRSPPELLRRLLVIMIEDAVLHPDAGYIAMLMAAVGRGYTMSWRDVCMVIQFAAQLAAAECRDMGVFENAEEKEGDVMEAEYWKMIVALKVRAAYGGVGGDVSMLQGAERVWKARFAEDQKGWMEILGRVCGTKVGEDGIETMFKEEEAVLRRGDIPLAAFDFHCCEVGMEVARKLMHNDMVVKRFGGGLDGVMQGVERLMWKYRSSINVKKVWKDLKGAKEMGKKEQMEGGEEEVLWVREIEGAVNEWCRNYRKRFGV